MRFDARSRLRSRFSKKRSAVNWSPVRYSTGCGRSLTKYAMGLIIAFSLAPIRVAFTTAISRTFKSVSPSTISFQNGMYSASYGPWNGVS